ncbi:MAG: hypothetical protein DRH24_05385 [Deltaproteobacteria bacterium]|nr:MAG: hypothetical protein DRH24_05385 [Deltaproteobacteria bacterium]
MVCISKLEHGSEKAKTVKSVNCFCAFMKDVQYFMQSFACSHLTLTDAIDGKIPMLSENGDFQAVHKNFRLS